MDVCVYVCVFQEQGGYHFYFPFPMMVGSVEPVTIDLLPHYLYYKVSFFVWGNTMWNTILINQTYCEPSNNDADGGPVSKKGKSIFRIHVNPEKDKLLSFPWWNGY